MSEQAKPVGASDKMKAKDFITLGIFTVLFFAVVMVCIFASAATVVTFAFGSAIAAIPGGIIYMLMRAKVPKAGSVLLSGVVIGLIEFLIGAGWAVAVGFIAGAVIAELLARMGNPSASEEQVIAAAKAAQCHEFISKLPGGYHTVVGSKGIHLSGGERQRIAIARAIIKDSPIIVLDEATAFSDPENEYLIQKAFEKLMQGKTVIIIAHRLSTIRNADKIIVMEKGHLIEEGKHDELVAAGGRYAQMWNHYTEAIGWKISGKAV